MGLLIGVVAATVCRCTKSKNHPRRACCLGFKLLEARTGTPKYYNLYCKGLKEVILGEPPKYFQI